MDNRVLKRVHKVNPGASAPTRWIGITQVAERYSVSDTEIRRQVRQGRFPKPVLMGERLARWSNAMLDAHDASLLSQIKLREVA